MIPDFKQFLVFSFIQTVNVINFDLGVLQPEEGRESSSPQVSAFNSKTTYVITWGVMSAFIMHAGEDIAWF